MTAETLPAILCVDDEPHVLQGVTLTLRRHFAVTTAPGGEEGLRLLENSQFAVVMSDMRMPKMDGAKFLTAVRAKAPASTRVLLTGNSDIQSAIIAVNEGQIFRFLTKPCPPELLIKSLQGAVEQNRLVLSERELLEKTLHGSVRALSDVLAVANPAAFGCATRLKRMVGRLALAMGITDRWAMEVAAMFSQIGYVVLPPATVERVLSGKTLSPGERQMVEKVPAIARRIAEDIPRLEPVQEVLEHWNKAFSGAGTAPGDTARGARLPIGARILRIAIDHDRLEESGLSPQEILKTMKARAGLYDPTILALLDELPSDRGDGSTTATKLADLRPGMVVAEDIKTSTGTLLVARGNEITESSLQRLFNFASSVGLREPILVAAQQLGRAA